MVEVRALPSRALAEPEGAEARIARDLADVCERRDGHPCLGDAVWRDLDAPAEHSLGFVAMHGTTTAGYLRVTERPVAPLAVDFAMAVDPEHREGGAPRALLEAALEYAENIGAHHASLWVYGADIDDDALAASEGLAAERELWQMRVPLPLAPTPKWPDGVVVRSFIPGVDDDAWLAVNNSAFAADPDQGGWTPEIFAGRLAEPWFDPVGFLVADDGGRMAGFCWTKVHAAEPPHEPLPLGEIYVIGANPADQGRGLGRALVLAGLAHLHDERAIDVGMLFVDGANHPAVALYRSLGFVTSRVDRAYGRVLDGQAPS